MSIRVLGLDPGSRHTGYGLVDRHGDRLVVVDHGRLSCPGDLAVVDRMGWLARKLREVVDRHTPDVAALEALFHGVNSRSLIVLAQARGAILVPLSEGDLAIREFAPAEVKSAVTGYGRADKGQVQRMVRLLLGLGNARLSQDASDALAVAICAANHLGRERVLAASESRAEGTQPSTFQGLSRRRKRP